MQPIWISLVACGVMLVGAVMGVLLRRWLPDHHLDEHTRDIVRLGAGLVGTIAALVLGLLINSASSSYEAQRNDVRQIATDVILLDDLLEQIWTRGEASPRAAPAGCRRNDPTGSGRDHGPRTLRA